MEPSQKERYGSKKAGMDLFSSPLAVSSSPSWLPERSSASSWRPGDFGQHQARLRGRAGPAIGSEEDGIRKQGRSLRDSL